jgi:hypothetical protein
MSETHTYTPDNLIAGGFPLTTGGVTVASGQNLTRGSVLGLKTADEQGVLVDSAATDGTENPYCILAEDVDASEAEVEAPVYLSGEFNEDALVFGGSDTIADHRAALRDLSLFTATNVSA